MVSALRGSRQALKDSCKAYDEVMHKTECTNMREANRNSSRLKILCSHAVELKILMLIKFLFDSLMSIDIFMV